MQEQQIIDRIKELCAVRSWTYYRLAKESGITYSTLNTMMNKSAAPSLATLTKICSGFGISLAEFFGGDEAMTAITKEDRQHLAKWDKLSQKEKENAEKYIDFLIYSR